MRNASRPLRALVVLRLSQLKAGSASIDAQRERVHAHCQALGYEVVAEAVDEGVSGTLSPFKRPGFGRWLTDRPPTPYDVVAAFHISRITRSARDAHELIDWLHARGKTLITADDGINTGSTFGKPMIAFLAALAEAEREAVIARLHAAAQTRRRQGYILNKTLTGYDTVQDGIGKRLVQNKDATVVRQVVDNIIQGESIRSQAPLLRAATGLTWNTDAVSKLLRNPALAGYGTHHGELVRDEFGKPITFTDDPIISPAKFARLQEALAERSTKRTSPLRGSPFAVLVKCAHCGAGRYTTGPRKLTRLMCRTDGCRGGEILESVVYEVVSDAIHRKFPEDVDLFDYDVPQAEAGLDAQLEDLQSREFELREHVTHLLKERDAYADLGDVYDDVLSQYRDSLRDVRREIQDIVKRKSNAGRLIRVPLGKTLYELWPATYEAFKDADKHDIRFILAFCELSVSVTSAWTEKGKKIPPHDRVKITELSTAAWKEALNQS